MVDVIPRSVWGARHEDGGGSAPVPFTEWWLHHPVTIAPDLVPPFDDEYAAMRTLEDIGESRFGRGISYTWPIMPTGRVYQGHSVNRLGAHTGGRNSVARAICLVGNYDVNEVTPQQIEAAAQLMVQEYRAGRATRYTLNGGHRQAPGASTACPGRYGMEAIPLINARAIALMGGAEEDDMADSDTILKEIRELNRMLGNLNGWPRAANEHEAAAKDVPRLVADNNRILGVMTGWRAPVRPEEAEALAKLWGGQPPRVDPAEFAAALAPHLVDQLDDLLTAVSAADVERIAEAAAARIGMKLVARDVT